MIDYINLDFDIKCTLYQTGIYVKYDFHSGGGATLRPLWLLTRYLGTRNEYMSPDNYLKPEILGTSYLTPKTSTDIILNKLRVKFLESIER